MYPRIFIGTSKDYIIAAHFNRRLLKSPCKDCIIVAHLYPRLWRFIVKWKLHKSNNVFTFYSILINIEHFYKINQSKLDIFHKWLRIIRVGPVYSHSHNHLIWIEHGWLRELVKFFHLQWRDFKIQLSYIYIYIYIYIYNIKHVLKILAKYS